jgi:hypothetical protein
MRILHLRQAARIFAGVKETERETDFLRSGARLRMLGCVEVRAFVDTNRNNVSSAARPRHREIEMVMVAAARVKRGMACRANRVAFEVGGDG